MYKIFFTDISKKDLKNLDIGIQKRIVKKLKEYSSDPLHFSRKLQNISIGSFGFRIGEYRVSFGINEDEVIILRIINRKDINR